MDNLLCYNDKIIFEFSYIVKCCLGKDTWVLTLDLKPGSHCSIIRYDLRVK